MPTYVGFSTIGANEPKTTNASTGIDGGVGGVLKPVIPGKKYRIVDEALVIRDFINVLKVNSQPDSSLPMGSDNVLTIIDQPVLSDGLVDDFQVVVSFDRTGGDIAPVNPDFFDDIVNMESDAWIYESEGDLIGMTGARYGRLDSLTHVKNLAEQGKRIASVWGTDKPIVGFSPTSSDVNFLLVDSPVYLPKYPFKNVYANVDRVLFYWSDELPELMVKQAHVVAKEIHKPENIHIYNAVVNQGKKLFKPSNLSTDTILSNILTINSESMSYSPKTVYQRGIVPFIYPNTHDPDLFQSRKFESGQTFHSAFNNWIKDLHGDTRIMQMITSDFSLFYRRISPKYLNPNKTGFNVCRKIFKIGSHDDFKPLTK